ncbi:alkaline phosphatase family protein [Paracidobacterium acidisoli]|uniref:alkaline phosphatase family protein n=1 Tax=Paracidobacterium acidisoli TaxID=2303751 RepID=UPI0018F25D2A|nr:ectonucleotide pyrophosphatase/phosphodiesterase [Paracidobacterium acidisoli]MBT9330011.1 ectonucleotide pyrophosphatase/phosphodiesterase [Paracidobacterium acidisoli]
MSFRFFRRVFLCIVLPAVCALCAACSAWAAPVLMISIDGLKPEYVTHADEHGLKVPTLRRFLTEGTYADGVQAVLPTVTYPDHTTLITGVWPIRHGILNNPLFDPERKFSGAWYWYASSIKVPTLWDAAHAAGIRTASVSWPVSVNATSVDWLIPEYWRSLSPAGGGNPQDRELMAAISRPDGALAEMEKRLGPYMMGNETTLEGDATRTRFSLDILRREKPGFMTIHLSSLDEAEHLTGPFSEESDKTLEAIDGMVKELMDAALGNDPQTRVVIVSDHGFVKVDHLFNLYIPFLQAGLIETGKDAYSGAATVTAWKAEPWPASGLAAIVLHDPADAKTKEQVRTLLDRLAADPANGIARILDADEVKRDGGFPDAAFVLAMKPGYAIGTALSGALVTDHSPVKGTHGYLPSFPEMHSSFFMMGEGVAKGRDLGTIDMRQIAPTVAGVLGVSLTEAKQPALRIMP